MAINRPPRTPFNKVGAGFNPALFDPFIHSSLLVALAPLHEPLLAVGGHLPHKLQIIEGDDGQRMGDCAVANETGDGGQGYFLEADVFRAVKLGRSHRPDVPRQIGVAAVVEECRIGGDAARWTIVAAS